MVKNLQTHPKVFVSHASEDKERFVLQFASKLRGLGIDAWVDKWEMYPGDSLVDKIFEEGIKNAHAIIIVISIYSISKPWVKEELNASIVKKISKGSKIIPIVIDNCEIPEVLKSTVWERIKDIDNYQEELDRIVMAIHGQMEKPPLGASPKYTTITIDKIPDLTKIDTIIFQSACKKVLQTENKTIETFNLYQDISSLQIPEGEFVDSIAILERKGFIEGMKEIGGNILYFKITHYGFDEYLRRYIDKYDKIFENVCFSILNDGLNNNIIITDKLNQPIILIDHILCSLEDRGLINLIKGGGYYLITKISPELKRVLQEKE